MGKHDDNGSYPHDCYPDRRKVADRRERDRDELGLDRERRRFEDRVAGLGAFGLPVVLDGRVPRGVVIAARPRRPFPEDPHGTARDEVLRRPYARPLSPTRAEFIRRLVEASERPPLLTPSSHGLLQMPEPRHFAEAPRRVEDAARAFLTGGFGVTGRLRVFDAPAPRNAEAARRTTLAVAAHFLETNPTPEQLIAFAEGYSAEVQR